MIRAKFDMAAEWVNSHLPSTFGSPSINSEIEHAFAMLNALITKAEATFLIPDLFPGVALEVLYLHDSNHPSIDHDIEESLAVLRSEGVLTASALTLIGSAIEHEMKKTGTDTVRYLVRDKSMVIVFVPAVRSVVLQATGTTILTD